MALLPAVDAHHHLRDLEANSYPWLMPGGASKPGVEALLEGHCAHRNTRGIRQKPNAVIKISGLGMSATGWNGDLSRRLVRETLEIFGPARCLFGSSFPSDRLMIDYDTPWQVSREAISEFSPDEQHALLCGNAERVDRI